MIFVTGDTHGGNDIRRLNSKRFPEGNTLTKKDYVIITGDFGLVFSEPYSKFYEEEQHFLKWLSDKPWTTLFIDGNHENHTLLDDLPLVDMFDSYVGKVNDSVYHLKRGHVYNIDGNKIFTFGGARSTDRESRIVGYDWWAREVPNYAEECFGVDNLKRNNNKVEYVLSHTGPSTIIAQYLELLGICHDMDPMFERVRDSTANYLQHILDTVEFKKWYFGHMHEDEVWYKNDKINFMYRNVIKLGDSNG